MEPVYLLPVIVGGGELPDTEVALVLNPGAGCFPPCGLTVCGANLQVGGAGEGVGGPELTGLVSHRWSWGHGQPWSGHLHSPRRSGPNTWALRAACSRSPC